jgi:hypothetical protein
MAIVYPLIDVPGIEATCLIDERCFPPGIVWRILEEKDVWIALHPMGFAMKRLSRRV